MRGAFVLTLIDADTDAHMVRLEKEPLIRDRPG
jgi:hypothetical protein